MAGDSNVIFTLEQMHLLGAAMLLEGEGSFDISWPTGSLQLKIRCQMTDLEPLEKLHRWCGGYLNGPYTSSNGIKDFWVWQLASRKELILFLTKIKPLMSPRRQRQIQKMIMLHRLHPLRKLNSHGTLSMYKHNKCRCNLCKEANTIYCRNTRNKLKKAS